MIIGTSPSPLPRQLVVAGVQLTGWAALTVGTNGDSVALAIRQTDGSGSVGPTRAQSPRPPPTWQPSPRGFDALPGVDVYVLTVAVDSASAGSTYPPSARRGGDLAVSLGRAILDRNTLKGQRDGSANVPRNKYSNGDAASIIANIIPCILYGFTVYNSNASAQSRAGLHVATVPANAANPAVSPR